MTAVLKDYWDMYEDDNRLYFVPFGLRINDERDLWAESDLIIDKDDKRVIKSKEF